MEQNFEDGKVSYWQVLIVTFVTCILMFSAAVGCLQFSILLHLAPELRSWAAVPLPAVPICLYLSVKAFRKLRVLAGELE